MSQTETKVEDKPVEIHVDLTEILKKIDEKFAALEAKISPPPKNESKGEAVPVTPAENRLAKIVESLRKGGLKEQWEKPFGLPPLPYASLLNFIKISEAISGGKAGDVVNIPYVKDVTASAPSAGNLQQIATSDLYGVAQTTLMERGAYSDIPYGDIEKITENLLAEIEASYERGIIRAIDGAILSAVSGATGLTTLDKSSATVNFDADWIAEAIAQTGKDFRPQDYVLVLTPQQYLALYKDIVSSQALTFARPDVVRDGLVQEFLGVKILVVPKAVMPDSGSKKYAFLIHKNAVVFAPKREMLFETDRMPKERTVRFAGSFTFGVAVVDPAACCRITTPESAS